MTPSSPVREMTAARVVIEAIGDSGGALLLEVANPHLGTMVTLSGRSTSQFFGVIRPVAEA
jgi:hypothetical protein